jgi:uncharacterized protein (TIGR00297 family)
MTKLFIGFIFSFIIGFLAYKRESLSFSGFIGALVLGTSLYFFGGLYLSGIMICFFISSSLLTKYRENEKSTLEDINEKTGGRDYAQVIANGGLGLIYALLYYFTKNPLFILAYSTSFAAANADTWSSEVGVLSSKAPISILSFKKTEKGMSGAVSLLGTAAAFCGSMFIAGVFFTGYILTFGWNKRLIYYSILITLAGFFGSIIDSYIGALLQAKYKCIICGKITEKKVHHNKKTIHVSGIKIINNDAVNFISCLLASLIVILIL